MGGERRKRIPVYISVYLIVFMMLRGLWNDWDYS